MGEKYDFSGWATVNDLLCSDGRTIKDGAFKENDGQTVPLVWQHRHDDPTNVLGHALLKYVPGKGMMTYGKFNDTEAGQTAKALVDHGDVNQLSIYANQLKQQGGNVLHGVIREVSLVLAGANPGACILNTVIEHSGEADLNEAEIYTGEFIELAHSEEETSEELIHEDKKDEEEKKEMAEEKKEKTVQDVFDELTEEQKNVVYFMIGQALEDAGVDTEEKGEEEEEMKHNVFDNETNNANYLSHSEMGEILNMAKSPTYGSFKAAVEAWSEKNDVVLQHNAAPSSGFTQNTNVDGNVTWLFPEYKDLERMPELITNDQGWVDVVLRNVHKSPMSRIRTNSVDIRNIDTLRAKGYKKGEKKTITGNFQLVRRTTDPQTVYVKSNLHRDDVVDITDFDYVDYLYNIDKMNLNEELAMAIMLGDFRADVSDDKISAEHIRPIWTDDELYTKHVDIDIEEMRETLQGTETGSYFGDNFVYAEAVIEALLYARETMKGSGSPDFFMTPHMLNVMLLARDRNGHRIFTSKAELASALNVRNIYTAEQFANRVRTDDNNNQHKLLGICVNLGDYNLGATKGGEVTHFTDFDIDFNQLKSLLETRCSGALTRVYSAVVIEEPVSE